VCVFSLGPLCALSYFVLLVLSVFLLIPSRVPAGALRQDLLADAKPALRGLLMVCLACVYSSNHGSSSHKLTEQELVEHLMRLDPESTRAARQRVFGHDEWEGIFDMFVKQHYLIKVRARSLCYFHCLDFALYWV